MTAGAGGYMVLQYLIVGIIILGAASFAGMSMLRRTRSFGGKSGCEADCGCSGKVKKAAS